MNSKKCILFPWLKKKTSFRRIWPTLYISKTMIQSIARRKSESTEVISAVSSNSSRVIKPIAHLNIIEPLWDELQRRLASKQATNTAEKFAQLEEEWKKISQSTIDVLIDFMPRCCQAVIDAKDFLLQNISFVQFKLWIFCSFWRHLFSLW